MNIYISALKKMLYLYIQILIIELKTSIKHKVSTEFISTFIALPIIETYPTSTSDAG